MVQNITWKADCHSAYEKNPAFFMKPEVSSPCSQKPNTGPYPEPVESSHLRLGLPSSLLPSGLPTEPL
jgi:hypothetical protein